MKSATERWLARHARLPTDIDLGLERVRHVWGVLAEPLTMPIIIVGGTNGKGSVCALLAAILSAAGYRVGCYTSPHVSTIGERVRIGDDAVADDHLLEALKTVAAAGQSVSLTYFELLTLAAALLFARARCHVSILEVGLGGRLDAVNVFSPAVSLITNVAMDHTDYLGDTVAAIAVEKAGICRLAKPLIVGDNDPEPALLSAASQQGAIMRLRGRDFNVFMGDRCWDYDGLQRRLSNLPLPALLGGHQIINAACGLAALESLPNEYWPGVGAIRAGLHAVRLPGRTQVLPGLPVTVLDVAHNPAAAVTLERFLFAMGYYPTTRAVLGMLARKDIDGFAGALAQRVDEWFVARPKGGDLSADAMAATLSAVGHTVTACPTIAAAMAQARAKSADNDRILVTGSFLTVADFWKKIKWTTLTL